MRQTAWRRRREALRIAGIYAVVGALWIALSDRFAAHHLGQSTRWISMFTEIEMLKGWAYVLVTAVLLYFLILNRIVRLQRIEAELQAEREQRARFEGALQTVRTLQHEINNPLQVLVGTLEMMRASDGGIRDRGRLDRLWAATERIHRLMLRLARLTDFESEPSPTGDRLRLPDEPS